MCVIVQTAFIFSANLLPSRHITEFLYRLYACKVRVSTVDGSDAITTQVKVVLKTVGHYDAEQSVFTGYSIFQSA